jgi:hypothetical protein
LIEAIDGYVKVKQSGTEPADAEADITLHQSDTTTDKLKECVHNICSGWMYPDMSDAYS